MNTSNVTISVRGESETRLAPERAVVAVAVSFDGPEREAVVTRVTRAAEELQRELADFEEAGRIDDWSSERLSVWADRPWNNEGLQLDLVHHAVAEASVTFADFAELSEWLGKVALRDGTQIGNISWELTPDTHARVEREAAAAAIDNATERASAYASALGLSTITAVEVADHGLLSEGRIDGFPPPAAIRTTLSTTAGVPEFQPGQITVTAAVEVRFVAS